MKIKDILNVLEIIAPLSLQEDYDNAGLITGDKDWECTGVLCSLDATEDVVEEAIQKKCNLVVAHHPIIFRGLKKITGRNYVERCVIKSIQNNIAIYAIHTNLDNVIDGVNGRMADQLGLINRQILLSKEGILKKLYCFVPVDHIEKLRSAIFNAGAGHIGGYSECSFNAEGTGTFKAGAGTNPYVGDPGKRHYEKEIKIEAIFPDWAQNEIINAMLEAHPYEEVAYDIVSLENNHSQAGSGLVGELAEPLSEGAFLALIKKSFRLQAIRHTPLRGKEVKRVAICGGAGSFLIPKALDITADFYITSDVKYHEFFDADGKMVVADIGHFESEQFTIELLHDILREKFNTFAVLKSTVQTNPVHYFF